VAIILIVDDDKTFLLSLVEGLRAHDQEFEIRTAENGKLATQILKDESVDLIITDLKMPVMDGFELLAYMSSHHPRIPVIVMTAYGTPVIENSVSHLGAIRYLEKPLDFDLLVDNIYNIVKPFDDVDVPGIQLTSFLKLLQMEKKTCVLTIRNQDQKGKFFLKKGNLIHAIAPNSSGETAVMEILTWGQPEIQISSKTFSVEKNIQHDLDFIMMVLESRQRSGRASGPVQPSAASTYDIELGSIFNVEDADALASSENVPAATSSTPPLTDQETEQPLASSFEDDEPKRVQPTEAITESGVGQDSDLAEESCLSEAETGMSPAEDEETATEVMVPDALPAETEAIFADENMLEQEAGLPEETSVLVDESSGEEGTEHPVLSAENPLSEDKPLPVAVPAEESADDDMTGEGSASSDEAPSPVDESVDELTAQDALAAGDAFPEEEAVLWDEPLACGAFPAGIITDKETEISEDHSVFMTEESIDAEGISGEEEKRPPISHTEAEQLTNLLEGKENAVNVKKMNEALNTLKETAGAGLISCDIYTTRDGQSIISYNGNETYCAMSNQITQYMINTIKEAGFPPMGNTYMVDLADDKMVIVLIMGDYQWGILIDTKKTSLGILLNVALPKAKAVFATALEN